jgi:O-antigen ligase
MELRKENELSSYIKWAILFFIAIVMASLAFSFRIFNSISIIFLVLLIFISIKRKRLLLNSFKNPVFVFLLIYFLVQASGLLYTHDEQVQIKEITQKAGIIAIPFFFMSGISLPNKRSKQLINFFSICLICVSLYCLIHAYAIYNETKNINVFFYHDLLKPFELHAVFFSWYLFFVILFCLESNFLSKKSRGVFKILISLNILFFIFLIILLSSKLVIISLIIYGIFFAIRALLINKVRVWWITLISGVIFCAFLFISISKNPVSNRFKDLVSGNDTLFLQNKFSPDIYFNGLQFRLLTWRLTGKILTENKAWLIGVSAGDAQQKLNEQYRLSHVYLGDGKSDNGFLNFNCHNVYLQSLLESGIIGLLLLLAFIVFLMIQIVKAKNWLALLFFICMLCFGFSESLFSSQYPIQLFLFLPMLLLVSNYKDQSYLFLTEERYFL